MQSEKLQREVSNLTNRKTKLQHELLNSPTVKTFKKVFEQGIINNTKSKQELENEAVSLNANKEKLLKKEDSTEKLEKANEREKKILSELNAKAMIQKKEDQKTNTTLSKLLAKEVLLKEANTKTKQVLSNKEQMNKQEADSIEKKAKTQAVSTEQIKKQEANFIEKQKKEQMNKQEAEKKQKESEKVQKSVYWDNEISSKNQKEKNQKEKNEQVQKEAERVLKRKLPTCNILYNQKQKNEQVETNDQDGDNCNRCCRAHEQIRQNLEVTNLDQKSAKSIADDKVLKKSYDLVSWNLASVTAFVSANVAAQVKQKVGNVQYAFSKSAIKYGKVKFKKFINSLA